MFSQTELDIAKNPSIQIQNIFDASNFPPVGWQEVHTFRKINLYYHFYFNNYYILNIF